MIPFFSTVTGEWVRDAGVVDGGYWYRNLRNQVRFGPAVADLLAQGHGVFVEVSAHPVLVQPITDVVDAADVDTAVVVGSLRREDGGPRRLLTSMAELFVRGVALDWSGVLAPASGRVDLPTYAFDHQHYWLSPAPAADAPSLGLVGADHPLLGAVVQLPRSEGLAFTSRLSLRSHPWLAEHAIGDVAVLPSAALVELAVRAGDEAGCPVLDELVVSAPLVLPAHGGVRVQLTVSGPDENGSRAVDVYSQRDGGTWTRHATGTLSATRAAAERFDFTVWPPSDAQQTDVADLYAELAEGGLVCGPAFQGVRAAWRRGEEIFAEVALPEQQAAEAGRFGIHPALLDAALQPAQPGTGGQPLDWHGLELHATGASALRVRLAPTGSGLSLAAADEAGGPVVTADSVVFRPVSAEQLGASATDTLRADALFHVDWTEMSRGRGRGHAALGRGNHCRRAGDPARRRAGGRRARGRGRGAAGADLARAGRRAGLARGRRPGGLAPGGRDPRRGARRGRRGDRPGRRGRVGPGPGRPGREPGPDRPARPRRPGWSRRSARSWRAASRSSRCAAARSSCRASPASRRPTIRPRCSVRRGRSCSRAPVRWVAWWPGAWSSGTACASWCWPAGVVRPPWASRTWSTSSPARAPRCPWSPATSPTATRWRSWWRRCRTWPASCTRPVSSTRA